MFFRIQVELVMYVTEIDDLTVSGRPKSYTISIGSPSSESGPSLGSPGSEGLGSPDSDFKWIPRKNSKSA